MATLPQPATVPTMYFIGVTTTQSSIMKVFPRWAEALGLDAIIKGIDIEIHAPAEEYQQVVDFIKNDPLSLGALVTTHKLDLLTAARDRFEFLGPYASLLSEVSSISKKDGQLCGHAKDPISAGLALEAFLPQDWWEKTGGEAFILGAGGSSLATSIYLMDPRHGKNRPSKIIVANRSKPRLEHMEQIHKELDYGVECEYYHCPTVEDNDKVLAKCKPCSLVANATGLGKDRPGSPLSDAAIFPEKGLIWEYNYRGDLLFLHQAQKQEAAQNLHVEDGWIYFIHGWTQVIAEVFHIDIDSKMIEKLSKIAAETCGR